MTSVKREHSPDPLSSSPISPGSLPAYASPARSHRTPNKAKTKTTSLARGGDIKPDFRSPQGSANTDEDEHHTSPLRGSPKKPRATSGAGGTAGGRARIDSESKRIIAHYAANRGFSSAEVQELVEITGLTAQQVRSQIAPDRSNVRRQLDALIDTIQ